MCKSPNALDVKGNTAWLGLGTFRGAAPLGVCMFARRHCR